MESACYVLYSVLAYSFKYIQCYVVCYIFCSFIWLFWGFWDWRAVDFGTCFHKCVDFYLCFW